MLEIQRIS